MLTSFRDKVVLITGGTRGIGLSSALLFARLGAQCIVTYRWGPIDKNEFKNKFLAVGASAMPIVFRADVGKQADTEQLMQHIKKDVGLPKIDAFVNNVSLSAVIPNFSDYTLKSLQKSIRYSAWPLVAYTKQIHDTFGCYPGHIVAVSSNGPDQCLYGYDYVAFSKTILETLCRYMAYRLRRDHVCINAVRPGAVKTQSLKYTFRHPFLQFVAQMMPDSHWISLEEVAGVIVMLCSGLFDAMNGQLIMVDRGTKFHDIIDLYASLHARHTQHDE